MPTSRNSFDLAVIGGGVIGLTIAWRAAQRGMRTALLERGEPGAGTSHVAAGMLAPITEADPGERALLALGLQSARAYPGFVAELSQATGCDPGYRPCGTLVVARDGDEAVALERELRLRRRLGLAAGRLRASAARHLEPALAPGVRLALEVPDDHAIDPRGLTAALVAALARSGARVRAQAEVSELVLGRGRVAGVRLTGGEVVAAQQVVVAAGVWSGAFGGTLGADVPVRAVKGQIVRLRDPSGPGLLTRVIRMANGYLVPRGDGRYVLGATMEERGFDTSVTAGGVLELVRDAVELVPGVAELVIEELSAGLRPGTPDNAPIIGPGAIEGLHWATGHYRNGILLAPITAEMVLAGVRGESSGCSPEGFSPGRFGVLRAADGRRSATVGAPS